MFVPGEFPDFLSYLFLCAAESGPGTPHDTFERFIFIYFKPAKPVQRDERLL
jgi:hypothetical protein